LKLLPKNMKLFFNDVERLDRAITIRVNWSSILFYLTFISYGYFSAMTSSLDEASNSPLFFIMKNSLIILVLFLFGRCSITHKNLFEDRIKLSYKDFFFVVVTVIFLLIFLDGVLGRALISDEIAYSSVSFGYAQYIANIVAQYTNMFDDWKYADLVQVFSAFILGSFVLLVFLLNRLTFNKKIALFIVTLMLIRLIVLFIHGNSYPHPPLNLLPTLVFGTLFGIDDMILKLSFFIGYVIFVLVIYKMISRKYSSFKAIITALAIATIPLFINFSMKIEHSLWGGVAITIVLLDILTAKKVNYIRMSSFVSIFAMMRMPVFVAIIPLFLHYVFFRLKDIKNLINSKSDLLEIGLIFYPAAIFLPFLINSLMFSTPSTETGGYIDNITMAFQSGIVVNSVVNSVGWLWIVLAFLPFIFMKNLKITVIFFTTFCFLVVMYFSINASHWYEVKYKIEWFLPFSIVGLIFIVNFFSKTYFHRNVAILFLGLILLNNFYQYKTMLNRQVSVDYFVNNYSSEKSNKAPIWDIRYNLKPTYRFIIENELQGQTYSVGVTYGVFTELLNGYSVEDYRKAKDIYDDISDYSKKNNIPWTSASSEAIHANKKIKHLIIGFMFPRKLVFIEDMLSKGWVIKKEFYNDEFKSTVFLLYRAA